MKHQLDGRADSAASRASSAERCRERDLGAGERLAHWAAGLGGFRSSCEGGGVEPRDRASNGQVDARDAGAGREGDAGSGLERLRRRACFVSALDRAMEKHEECAAAISSSGLVRPFGCSARDAHVTSNPPRPDDTSSTRPVPSISDPFQVVRASRVAAMRATLSVRASASACHLWTAAVLEADRSVAVVAERLVLARAAAAERDPVLLARLTAGRPQDKTAAHEEWTVRPNVHSRRIVEDPDATAEPSYRSAPVGDARTVRARSLTRRSASASTPVTTDVSCSSSTTPAFAHGARSARTPRRARHPGAAQGARRTATVARA